MSLSHEQQRRTGTELHANLTLSGLTVADLADELSLGEQETQRTLDLAPGSDPATVWLVRDHLSVVIKERGGEPFPYTVLTEKMRPAAERWFGLSPTGVRG